jgi:hypothetical protein
MMCNGARLAMEVEAAGSRSWAIAMPTGGGALRRCFIHRCSADGARVNPALTRWRQKGACKPRSLIGVARSEGRMPRPDVPPWREPFWPPLPFDAGRMCVLDLTAGAAPDRSRHRLSSHVNLRANPATSEESDDLCTPCGPQFHFEVSPGHRDAMASCCFPGVLGQIGRIFTGSPRE